jgi:hypothetical protein
MIDGLTCCEVERNQWLGQNFRNFQPFFPKTGQQGQAHAILRVPLNLPSE